MEIYIEKIIILNIIIHLLLVVTTNFITSNKSKKKLIVISTILGSGNLFCSLFYPNTMYTYSYFIVIIISFISFFNIKSTLIYLMLNFILGGISGVVNLSINYYYEVIIISTIVILFIIFYFKNQHCNEFKIIIKENKEYKLNAFYDSGCLINIGLTPIIILNEKFDIDLEFFTTFNVDTIGGTTTHKVYKANNIFLIENNKKIEKQCLIIKANIAYDVIIGKNFIGGL